jgi:opacity protein-like surface antigen
VTWRLVVALAAMLLLFCNPAAGQQSTSAGDTVRAPRVTRPAADSAVGHAGTRARAHSPSTVSVWGGGSVHPGGVLGKIPEGWVGLLGIRYHRLLLPRTALRADREAPTLTYTADVVPLASVSIPKGVASGTPVSTIQSVRETGLSTYGVGAYPIGLRVGVRPTAALQPFLAGHTGFLYLFDPMPDERGQQLNFAAGVGAGVRVALSPNMTLTLGYRYHHLSNGFRGSINPGLDANLLYVGLGVAP